MTGDVSGGNAALQIQMDPRYCALVAWLSFADVQVSSADADVRFALFGSLGRIPIQIDSGLVVATSATVSSSTLERTWAPQPFMLPGDGGGAAAIVQAVNVDADVYTMSAMIYLFDIRVRELTPMGPLLWARGST